MMTHPYTDNAVQYCAGYCVHYVERASHLASERAVDDLSRALSTYEQPHRHYHTRDHLEDMLREIDPFLSKLNRRDKFILLFAALFHDIVYDTDSIPSIAQNELKSAEEAVSFLYPHDMGDIIANRVSDLIKATKTHQVADDPLAALLVDADLAVLGRMPIPYDAYTKAIREEFKPYEKNGVQTSGWSDTEFYEGRLEHFLRPFLNRDRIFHTQAFSERYERQARENLAREERQVWLRLARLGVSVPYRTTDSGMPAKRPLQL